MLKRIGKLLIRGVSLLEVMLSLAIIALLIALALRYFVSAQNLTSINQSRESLEQLFNALKHYSVGGQPASNPPSAYAMQQAGLIDFPECNATTCNLPGARGIAIGASAIACPASMDIGGNCYWFTVAGFPSDATCAHVIAPFRSTNGATCLDNESHDAELFVAP